MKRHKACESTGLLFYWSSGGQALAFACDCEWGDRADDEMNLRARDAWVARNPKPARAEVA